VRPVIRPTEVDRAEVMHEKDKELALTEAYEDVRDQFSFQDICEANLHALLEWKLGPLASTSKFLALMKEVVCIARPCASPCGRLHACPQVCLEHQTGHGS
jgi:hypothetical protein